MPTPPPNNSGRLVCGDNVKAFPMGPIQCNTSLISTFESNSVPSPTTLYKISIQPSFSEQRMTEKGLFNR